MTVVKMLFFHYFPNCDGDKFSRGIFSVITDFVFSLFFFDPSPPHNSQRIDANTEPTTQRRQHIPTRINTNYHIITHAHTTKHNQTQPNTNTSQTQHPFPAQIQAHFSPSGTRLAQLYQDICFLHCANMVRPTRNGPRSMHSGPQAR